MFVARACLTATAATVLLRVAPLPAVVRWVGRRPGAVSVTTPRMVALTDRVLGVNHGPLRPNCVLRSLVLFRYLPRTDGPVTLQFGVRPGIRPIDGHAWVEQAGAPLAERSDPRSTYSVTWSWP